MYKGDTEITGSNESINKKTNKVIVPIGEYAKKLSKEEIEKIKASKIQIFPDLFLNKSFSDNIESIHPELWPEAQSYKLYITLLEASVNAKIIEKNNNKEN